MIALLVDIHLAEGDMLDRSLPAEEQEVLLREHYGMILARHRITAKQLQESYAYYIRRSTAGRLVVEGEIPEMVLS